VKFAFRSIPVPTPSDFDSCDASISEAAMAALIRQPSAGVFGEPDYRRTTGCVATSTQPAASISSPPPVLPYNRGSVSCLRDGAGRRRRCNIHVEELAVQRRRQRRTGAAAGSARCVEQKLPPVTPYLHLTGERTM
jgi:hypothetical protein